MKTIIIFIFSLVSFVGSAQTDIALEISRKQSMDNTKGFNNYRLFEMFKGNFGVYPMKVYASFEYEKGNQRLNFFFNKNGKFYMEEDKDNVYDSVRYSYEIKEQNMLIHYKIYSLANGLFFTINNEKYEYSLIDGASDMVIKDLDYQYKNIGSKEFLFLNILNDICLFESKPFGQKHITLKKGGFIIFEIDANTLKLK